jgi:hypothetical protein
LARVPASAYLVPKGVVAIDADASYTSALRKLKEEGVSAAVVFSNEVTGVRALVHPCVPACWGWGSGCAMAAGTSVGGVWLHGG